VYLLWTLRGQTAVREARIRCIPLCSPGIGPRLTSQQDFERKSALFSLASAEVILVNLWEHQVGLYQGANMGLLKTVMEVNLALFQAGRAKTGNGYGLRQ
jgi:hypothetical protein